MDKINESIKQTNQVKYDMVDKNVVFFGLLILYKRTQNIIKYYLQTPLVNSYYYVALSLEKKKNKINHSHFSFGFWIQKYYTHTCKREVKATCGTKKLWHKNLPLNKFGYNK